MRSTYFERPIEYQLLCNKEEWLQGDTMSGQLLIKNNSTDTLDVQEIHLVLAYGITKKLKNGEGDAWTLLEEQSLSLDPPLPTMGQVTLDWEMRIPTDAPVTDKNGSLFLLFGRDNVFEKGGKIDVRTSLIEVLQSFLQTFTTQFQFVQKYIKANAGWTEVKLIPPKSREYPNLEHILCFLRVVGETMEIKYRFKVKTLSRSGESLKVRGKSREYDQSGGPDQYLQAGGFPNRNWFRQQIDLALSQVRPDVLF